MPLNEQPQVDNVLSFSDVKTILAKKKNYIWWSIAICTCVALIYGLFKPLNYKTQATFKEKGKVQPNLNNKSISQLLLNGETSDSEALTIMKSRKLLEELALQQNLQASLKPASSLPPFERVLSNLKIEYALLTGAKDLVIQDAPEDLKIISLEYDGEVPLTLTIVVSKEVPNSYSIFLANQPIGQGNFDQKFHTNEFSIKLSKVSSQDLSGKKYTLKLLPLDLVTERLSKKVTIEQDPKDKTLLKITYYSPDRHLAPQHVNALMGLYQRYVQQEHHRITSLQIDYLLDRQREMGSHLENIMQAHAKELSLDLSTTGFANSEKAMEFLASNQLSLKQKLLANRLELQRLEQINQPEIEYEKLASVSNSAAIQELAKEIQELKQQSDALNLALRSSSIDSHLLRSAFDTQLKELSEIKSYEEEIKGILTDLENGRTPRSPSSELLNHPKFIVKFWYERLPQNEIAQADPQDSRKGLESYLSHLMHYFQVHQRNIEGKLIQQQVPLDEFQGINLSTAKELYFSYTKELSHIESQINQQQFIIEQLDDPDFEISSLSSILTDPVSGEMISKASATLLALKDEDNRSMREQERLKTDLSIQKGFLTNHLQQLIVLMRLNQEFLKNKITNLQSVTFSLVHEQISILESNLKKMLHSQREQLLQEKKLIESNLADLRIEMASLPQKWAAEKLIEQQMDINKNMVEEIAKLVETKNISNNLEKIQSTPLDKPQTPVRPQSPYLILLTLLGAFLGALVSCVFCLVQSVLKGVQVSPHNLQAQNIKVCGRLSKHYQDTNEHLLDSDLETLRRIIAEISSRNGENMDILPDEPQGNLLLLIENAGPRYGTTLASLLSKKGFKVLVMDLDFSQASDENLPGLLQYLEGHADAPQIIHELLYDKILSGGISRYSNELLGSQLFKELLQILALRYDWIVLQAPIEPSSATAEDLLKQFPQAVVSVHEETLVEITNCVQLAKDPDRQISFVFV